MEIALGDEEEQEDVLAINLKKGNATEGEDITLVICYMTIEKGRAEREENSKKYVIVRKVIRECRGDLMIMGDLNGHIGLLGEEINGNGQLILDFCKEEELEILNLTRIEGAATWRGRDGARSAIDYALVNRSMGRRVRRMWVDEERECELRTDHNLMVVEIGSEEKKK